MPSCFQTFRHKRSRVVGIPDPEAGETVKACILLKDEYRGKVTEDDLMAWAKEHMAAYKYPRKIEFRETLPKTLVGKILRRELGEPVPS